MTLGKTLSETRFFTRVGLYVYVTEACPVGSESIFLPQLTTKDSAAWRFSRIGFQVNRSKKIQNLLNFDYAIAILDTTFLFFEA